MRIQVTTGQVLPESDFNAAVAELNDTLACDALESVNNALMDHFYHSAEFQVKTVCPFA
jgi:hypothetical protein